MSSNPKDALDKKSPAGRLPDEPFDTIKDASQIIRYVEKALVDAENVEVTINDRTRLYFSYFMDHLPEAIEDTLPKTEESPTAIPTPVPDSDTPPEPEVAKVYPTYRANSYLWEKKYIVLAPLSPAMGNALIRSCKEVDVRFFQGVKSLDFTVQFENTLMMRGEPTLKVSFPKEMRMIRKRRHYRAPCVEGADLQVFIKKNKETIQVRLVDMSVGGMGFCYDVQDPNEFPIGSVIKMEIRSPIHENLLVNAFIRNVGRAGPKDGCPRNSGKVGLQFDLPNETIATNIEETVAFLQREYLQLKQPKKPAPKPEARPEEEGKTDIKGEFTKLLNLRKKWSIP